MRELTKALASLALTVAFIFALFVDSISFSILVGALYIGRCIEGSVIILPPLRKDAASGIGVPPQVAEDWSSPEDGAWDYARSCGMSNCQGACGICEAAS